MKKVWLSWSSGKDSAWALHLLRRDPEVEVTKLLTTLNTTHDRVAMHSTRREILEAQARAIGLPLYLAPLPWPCPNEIYEQRMREACEAARREGATHIAFGDLFLEEIRRYRLKKLAGTGLEPLFPLWGLPTAELAREMTEAGMEAVLVCVNPKMLDPKFAGRKFDRALLSELPPSVDPCGENGEFHTCVLNGPEFRNRVCARAGEIVQRDGFVFADLALEPADSQTI